MIKFRMMLGWALLSSLLTDCRAAEKEGPISPSNYFMGIKVTFVDEQDEICDEIPLEALRLDANPFREYPKYKDVVYEVQRFMDVPDFATIKESLKDLYLQKRAPRSCVILDVDGTLTLQEDPTSLLKPTAVTPRPEASQFISWLDSHSFKRTYSSAWHIESQTLERLEALDLPVGGKDLISGALGIDEETFSYRQKGTMCSVRLHNFTHSNPYFRYKALSPIPVYADWQELETLVLIEDSEANAQDFVKHLEKYNPYPNLNKVLIFCLIKAEKLPESLDSGKGV